MKINEQLEYEKLKGDSINGTMSIRKAFRYFELRDKSKKEKANDKTRSKE